MGYLARTNVGWVEKLSRLGVDASFKILKERLLRDRIIGWTVKSCTINNMSNSLKIVYCSMEAKSAKLIELRNF